MARPPLDLEIDSPPRITGGDDVQLNLMLSARADADVAEATVRWVSRWTYHSRVWTFIPARLSAGWSKVLREQIDAVVSSARLPQIAGLQRPGSRTEAKVRLETVDVAPSTVMTGGFGSVLNRIEARLVLRDGTEVSQHRKVWVRPARTSAEARWPDGGLHDSGAIRILDRDGSPARYGELYRPVEGTLALEAAADDVGPGTVELRLTRHAQWQVHYLVPVDGRGAGRNRREWQEKTMEREVSQASVKLGSVAAPPVLAQGRAEVQFSFPGPRGTTQSTEYPEGFIAWTLDCVWSAGSWRAEAGTPIVMSMPVVSRGELEGSRARRWSWPGHRGGGRDVEASTGTG